MVAASRRNYRKRALFPSQKNSRVGRMAKRSCLTGRIARKVGRRPASRRDIAKMFMRHVSILMMERRAPTVFRTALAAHLVSVASRHRKDARWMHIKDSPDLHCIVRALKQRMVTEKEPAIRSAFLRLLAIQPFFRTLDWHYRPEGIDCILEVLEQERTEEEQTRALYLLGYVARACEGHEVTEVADPVVKMGVLMIHKHLDPTMPSLSESSIRRLIFCMAEYMWMEHSPAIMDPIINSPHAMGFFINGLRDTRILLPLVYPSVPQPQCASNKYVDLVSSIFEYAPTVSRQQLIDRHFAHVQEAILLMPFDYRFSEFAVHEEFANVIVRMPIILGKLASEVRNAAGNRYSYSRNVVMALLHGLRNNDSGLQVVLGYGVLAAVVPHFARTNHEDYAHVRDMASFRRILATHPEWKPAFKAYTRGGDARSHTYQLGAAIVDRVHKPAQYVMAEEVEDI